MTVSRRRALYQDRALPAADRAADLLARLTLAEKIGQMAQVEKGSVTPEAVREHGLGSVLSGGGGNPSPNTPQDWAAMVRPFLEAALETRLGIPLLYGADAVHGHNNVVGATIFPHNIGLGATRDSDLVARIGRITAAEMRATHVHWNFAPAVSVPQDIRWGRTYEGFSEAPDLVSALGAAYVRGLQGAATPPLRALASVKHFVGDGGTRWDSTVLPAWLDWWRRDEAGQGWRIDQGVADVDEATLRALHLPPYQAAIAAGARNIMVSYSSWGGLKMHAQRYLLTDVLKGELGFTGFLVSDWLAVPQLDPDYDACVTTAINAGLDMIMVPFDYERFIAAVADAVAQRAIPLARIDDAVRRILTVKFELGLFEQPFGDEDALPAVGSPAHRAVAREAVRRSLVLLKNENDTLPLAPAPRRLLLAGAAADDLGAQCGGWTIEWMGGHGDITPGTSLRRALAEALAGETELLYRPDGAFPADLQAETAVVVLAEEPYAEGLGDREDLALPAADLALLARVRPHCRRLVLVLFSGRPLILGDAVGLCDAIVAAWLPGTEGAGIADVLLGDVPFAGKLPVTWPRSMDQVPLARADDPLWPRGHGLN